MTAPDWRSARQLRALEVPTLEVVTREGDQAGLLEDWRDAHVLILDAASRRLPAGTIHRHDAAAAPLPARLSRFVHARARGGRSD